jgi:SWI/SNF-related matrix-associated actin-dependent regulator 1 of chromatin subfamily A
MLDILEAVMETLGLPFCRIDGSTPIHDRQLLIDEFQGDPSIPIFLLSTKAGGFGINLTSANCVLLFDMDFNPHNDAQAEDRAHRVGQTREVRVLKLVLEQSVETHMLRCATTKLKLDSRLQEGAGGAALPPSRRKSGGRAVDEDDDADAAAVITVSSGEEDAEGDGAVEGNGGVGEEEVVEIEEAHILDMLRTEWRASATS